MSQVSDAMLTTLEQIDSWHEPLLKDLHEHPARSLRRGAWRGSLGVARVGSTRRGRRPQRRRGPPTTAPTAHATSWRPLPALQGPAPGARNLLRPLQPARWGELHGEFSPWLIGS